MDDFYVHGANLGCVAGSSVPLLRHPLLLEALSAPNPISHLKTKRVSFLNFFQPFLPV